MNTEYCSIYLCILQLLSSVSYSFPCSDISLPWLNLFLSILSFLLILQMVLFS